MTLINGHLNQLLTNYSLDQARQGSGFIADQIAPPVPVSKPTDSYVVWGTEEFRLDDSAYASKAGVKRVTFSESDDTYTCKEYAQEVAIPWLKWKAADNQLQLERTYTAKLVAKLQLRKEKAAADLLSSGSTFTNTAALAAADRFNKDTSNPVAKAIAGKEAIRAAIGVSGNVAYMGAAVRAALSVNPDVTSRVAGLVAGTPATDAQIAAAMGLDRILVGEAVYDTAKEGNAKSLSDVWGKVFGIAYVGPGGEHAIAPAQQFVCDAAGTIFGTYTYEEENSRQHVVQCYDCRALKAIAVGAVYLYTTAID